MLECGLGAYHSAKMVKNNYFTNHFIMLVYLCSFALVKLGYDNKFRLIIFYRKSAVLNRKYTFFYFALLCKFLYKVLIMDFAPFIEKIKEKYTHLEQQMSDPGIFSRQKEYQEVSRDYRNASDVLKKYDRFLKCNEELADNRDMLSIEEDEEFKEVISNDIKELEKELTTLEGQIKTMLVPAGPNDSRNTILEIHPAAGGDEAGLFAYELFRVYCRYAEKNGWKVEVLELTENAVGGLKFVNCSIQGEGVFRKLHLESGVHRVQRVPATESGGRIHTSTVTCAVLPEVEEVDCPIKNEDLRFDTFRASGPGGQCVNTTDSAVRITHIPTGIAVASQQEKSQHKNREIAMRILRARIIQQMQEEEQAKYAAERKSQVGTGDRSERIRTYNFPQGRVTDHRFGVTRYDLNGIMAGEVEDFFAELLAIESERVLAAELERL